MYNIILLTTKNVLITTKAVNATCAVLSLQIYFNENKSTCIVMLKYSTMDYFEWTLLMQFFPLRSSRLSCLMIFYSEQ